MARYNGNNSYQNLLVASYAKNRIFELSRSNADLGMTIAPLSLQKTGYITAVNGISGRRSHGYIFLSRIYSKSSAYQLTVRTDAFYPNSEGGGKTKGISLRCVVKRGDATDSICPKGWEMARNSGDGSYRNLLVDIYGKNIIAEDLKSSNGQTDSGIKYLPISLLRAGFLRLIEPHIVVRNSRGDYWIPHVSYSTSGHNFDFHGSGFTLGNTSPKGYGYSVRCVAKVTSVISEASA